MASESKTSGTAPKPDALWQHVLLGTSSLRVSPMCLGTMTWGSKWGIGSTKEQAKEVFTAFCEAGGNFIDTANKYHEGQSEEWLGEFMADAGNRDELVVATKYSLPMTAPGSIKPATEAKEDGTPKPYINANFVGNHRKNLRRSVKESLKRLGTDYVDVYYVHYWDYITAPEEIMRTLNDLVSAGTILHAAVSDAPIWAVAECNALAKAHHWEPFVALQYKYSLLDRTIERDALHYARHRNTTVVTWDCLGGGRLTGKYKRGSDSSEADSNRASSWGIEVTEEQHKVIDVVSEVAEELGSSCAQVSLAWNLRQPNCLPLIGARTKSQLLDNLGALSLAITPAQLAKLDDATKLKDVGFVQSFIGTDYASNQWATAAKVLPDVK